MLCWDKLVMVPILWSQIVWFLDLKKNQIIYLTSAASDPQIPLWFLMKISTSHDLATWHMRGFIPFKRFCGNDLPRIKTEFLHVPLNSLQPPPLPPASHWLQFHSLPHHMAKVEARHIKAFQCNKEWLTNMWMWILTHCKTVTNQAEKELQWRGEICFFSSTQPFQFIAGIVRRKMELCVLSWQSVPCSPARFLMDSPWWFRKFPVCKLGKTSAQYALSGSCIYPPTCAHTERLPPKGAASANFVQVSLHNSMSQWTLRSLGQPSGKRNPSRAQWPTLRTGAKAICKQLLVLLPYHQKRNSRSLLRNLNGKETFCFQIISHHSKQLLMCILQKSYWNNLNSSAFPFNTQSLKKQCKGLGRSLGKMYPRDSKVQG